MTEASISGLDELSSRLRREAEDALKVDPELRALFGRTVLAPEVTTFEEAVVATVCYRMLLQRPSCSGGSSSVAGPGGAEDPMFCPQVMRNILSEAIHSDELVAGHTMAEAVREDALAIMRRDPACETLLEIVLFFKGFAALTVHRAAKRKWMAAAAQNRRSFTSLFLQSQASAVFGVDIHPGATIGAGVMIDHATGVVIGETASLGDGSTMLHGVTLGGTGKDTGDRHPKVGKNVLIGAGSSILGNIVIGDGCKIGAGSIVLRPLPKGATAVGAPAKIVGRSLERSPGSFMDTGVSSVRLLENKSDSMSNATGTTEPISEISDDDGDSPGQANVKKNDVIGKEVEVPSNGDCFCPFREYLNLAKKAPCGSLTICKLRNVLKEAGVNDAEIGQIFFALDTTCSGYIPSKAVHCAEFQKLCTSILQTYTTLEPEQLTTLMEKIEAL